MKKVNAADYAETIIKAIPKGVLVTTKADKTLRKNLLYITAGSIGASTLIGLIISAFL